MTWRLALLTLLPALADTQAPPQTRRVLPEIRADVVTGDPDDLEGAAAALGASAAIGRPGLPADIAAAAAYLASDDAEFVTGHALAVDAGYTTIAGPSPFATGEHAEAGMLLGPVRQRPS